MRDYDNLPKRLAMSFEESKTKKRICRDWNRHYRRLYYYNHKRYKIAERILAKNVGKSYNDTIRYIQKKFKWDWYLVQEFVENNFREHYPPNRRHDYWRMYYCKDDGTIGCTEPKKWKSYSSGPKKKTKKVKVDYGSALIPLINKPGLFTFYCNLLYYRSYVCGTHTWYNRDRTKLAYPGVYVRKNAPKPPKFEDYDSFTKFSKAMQDHKMEYRRWKKRESEKEEKYTLVVQTIAEIENGDYSTYDTLMALETLYERKSKSRGLIEG